MTGFKRQKYKRILQKRRYDSLILPTMKIIHHMTVQNPSFQTRGMKLLFDYYTLAKRDEALIDEYNALFEKYESRPDMYVQQLEALDKEKKMVHKKLKKMCNIFASK